MVAAEQIRQKILDYLQTQEQGAHALQIADAIGHNRVTVGKYLDILHAEGAIDMRAIGQAKVWSVTAHAKPKVLIVDDELHVCNLIELTLGEEKYALMQAHDGEEALTVVHKEMPDLLVLDVMMPKMDGFAVCKALKENILTRSIIVVLLTAKSDVKDKIQGVSAGADYYMTKPFDPSELEAVVEAMLQKKEASTDTHPITQLPFEARAHLIMQQHVEQGGKTVQIILDGFQEFIETAGFRHAGDLLKSSSRIIQSCLQKTCGSGQLVHSSEGTFVCLIDDRAEELKTCISEELNAARPFLLAVSENKNVSFVIS